MSVSITSELGIIHGAHGKVSSVMSYVKSHDNFPDGFQQDILNAFTDKALEFIKDGSFFIGDLEFKVFSHQNKIYTTGTCMVYRK